MSKTIPLVGGGVTFVDGEDYEALAKYRWRYRSFGTTSYVVRDTHIRHGAYDYQTVIVFMHREILKMAPGEITDHANGDTLDNRRSNLRKCTKAQNQQNQGRSGWHGGRPTSSKYKGVYWAKREAKWMVQIMAYGKRTHVGSFKDEREAALAYDKAARKLHGEFARLNFPEQQS